MEADADVTAEPDADEPVGGVDEAPGVGATARDHLAATAEATPDHWAGRYLRDQSVHFAVLALLAAYPGIYSLLVTSQSGVLYAVLPRVETMVAVLYFGLFAMSFDFISGYTGYLSFGHAAFYGTGAYTVILVANAKLSFGIPFTTLTVLGPGTPFMVSLLLAGLLAALLALVIGSVSFRLTGVYFAMITLGFAQVLYVLVRDWDFVAANPSDGPAVSFDTHPGGFNIGVPWLDELNLAVGQLTGDSVALSTLALTFVDLRPLGLGFHALRLSVHNVAVGLGVLLAAWVALARLPTGRALVAHVDARLRASVGVEVPAADRTLPAALAVALATVAAVVVGLGLALSPVEIDPTEVSYYMIGLVVAGCYFAMQRIVHSPFGRVMIAIRENEERAEAVGYEPFRYKLGAFVLSGFFAGIAGGLFAAFRRSATPDNAFFFLVTGDALLVSIIGGFGTLVGPLYGRLFDETVREFLSKQGAGGGLLPFLRANVPADLLEVVVYNGLTVQGAIETFLNGHAPLYLGLLFVAFVLYVPNGMVGTVRDRLGGTVAKRVPVHLGRYVRRYLR